jgi:hypothetical protein
MPLALHGQVYDARTLASARMQEGERVQAHEPTGFIVIHCGFLSQVPTKVWPKPYSLYMPR